MTPAAPAAAAPSVGVHHMTASAESVAAKWTPEAMRAAIPLDRLLPRTDTSKLTQDVPQGLPEVVEPTLTLVGDLLGDLLPMVFPEGGGG